MAHQWGNLPGSPYYIPDIREKFQMGETVENLIKEHGICDVALNLEDEDIKEYLSRSYAEGGSPMTEGLSLIDTIDNGTIVGTLKKINDFQMVIQKTLKSGHDYDTIPGTNKPTLLKPGAEKICMLFGLNPIYDFLEKAEDYKNEFFHYDIRCTLFKGERPVAQGIGSCNSKEKKYRYVNVYESEIPQHLDKANLVVITDGHGHKKYKIENPDIFSLVNTILKMAKKRAHIDATLQVAALSEIFTQDVEDMQEFIQREQIENMTVDEAAGIIIKFGKHKGKSLGEIYKQNHDYVQWFLDNGTDPIVKKAFQSLEAAVKESKENKANNSSKNEQLPPWEREEQ